MLTGEEIIKEVENGNITITPFKKEYVNPNSYNMTLSDELLVYTDDVLDCAKNNNTKIIKIPKEGLILAPGTLYIAKTNEITKTDKYASQISGRSSIGRVGLTIHTCAAMGNIGYEGSWSLDITCVRPTRIFAGMQLCQIYFWPIEGKINKKYSGKYQKKQDITPSKSYEDFKKEV